MKNYTPILDESLNNVLVLDTVLRAEECLVYAKTHNLNVKLIDTTSTKSVETIMLFVKNGFSPTFDEVEQKASDGTLLKPKVECLLINRRKWR